jgi:hypothetical protein
VRQGEVNQHLSPAPPWIRKLIAAAGWRDNAFCEDLLESVGCGKGFLELVDRENTLSLCPLTFSRVTVLSTPPL